MACCSDQPAAETHQTCASGRPGNRDARDWLIAARGGGDEAVCAESTALPNRINTDGQVHRERLVVHPMIWIGISHVPPYA